MPEAIDWTEELITRICSEVASGRGVNEVSKEPWCPSEASIYRRAAQDLAFAGQLNAARAAQQEFEADNVVAMADKATAEDWQVVKLRIWARQWRAAKLAPKKYGEKLEVAGDPTAPLVTRIERTIKR